jgi:hypothetical protein
MATQFSDIYGNSGLGHLVGDEQSGSVTKRKLYSNDAYVQLAGIRGYWRKRSYDYTSASTIPLVAGNYQFQLPTSPAFDSVYRLYYLSNGRPRMVKILNDDQWLEQATIATGDTGDPAIARIVQTATQKQLELSPRISSNFLSSTGTLTLEYFIEITRLTADADEPILPENYRHYIKYLAAKLYAIGQGDTALVALLRENGVTGEAEKGLYELQRHDLTRTGHSQGLRPRTSYLPGTMGGGGGEDYGERD